MNQSASSRPPASIEIARDLAWSDLRAALASGWRDFSARPGYGLFFGAVFAVSGLVLSYLLLERGEVVWLIPAAAGFPLLAPFTAVGLYEVSRRREANLPTSWPAVLGALKGRGDEQIMSMGVILFVAFGFWIIVAHGVFAVFMAEAGAGSESLAFFTTRTGLTMLGVGSAVGAVIALAFYSITLVSLPMLVDRKVDFLTAIITSLRAFKANFAVLLGWAFVIAAALFIAMIPAFLGLLVILPVLGHATWHLYKHAVQPDPA